MPLLQQLANLNAGLALIPIKPWQAGILDVLMKRGVLELLCCLFGGYGSFRLSG